ncbi:MAG: nucleoside triphosphate pyrophosphohydrolase [Actinomycetales bacterium]|nr:nucleoside triphosphate pyrophosphohydrolase [Actinomycetales bacterium]
MGKLVRDRIPDIIRADGSDPLIRVLDEGDYFRALLDKLVEEAQEARESTSEGLLEELADVREVLLAICAARDWTGEDVDRLADRKRAQRGSFRDRLWLEE